VDGCERPQALLVWMALSEVLARGRVRVDRALQQRAGLTLADTLVLCQVALAPGGRLRMVDIADRLGIGKSAVTKTVDRLERRGWVVRQRPGLDRRTVHATLAPTGAEVFRSARPVFVAAVTRELTGPLTGAELGELRRLVGKLLGGGASLPGAVLAPI